MNPHQSAHIVIDVHAHLMVPEVYAATSAQSLFVKSFADATMSEAARKNAEQRTAYVLRSMSDVNDRIAMMDAMGVDVQVLSSSLVHQCTYWAAPAESRRLERMFNDRLARWCGRIRAASLASWACRCMPPKWRWQSFCAA